MKNPVGDGGDLKERRSFLDDGFKLGTRIWAANRIIQHSKSSCLPCDILDVGCGNAKILSYLLSSMLYPARYVGVDLRADALAQVILQYKKFEPVQIPFEKLDTIKGSFNVVIFTEVLEHISESLGKTTLSLIYKKLEPGGILVLTTPESLNSLDLEKERRIFGHVFFWKRIVLIQYLSSLGFNILENGAARYVGSSIQFPHVRKAALGSCAGVARVVEWMKASYGTTITSYLLAGFFFPDKAGTIRIVAQK